MRAISGNIKAYRDLKWYNHCMLTSESSELNESLDSYFVFTGHYDELDTVYYAELVSSATTPLRHE